MLFILVGTLLGATLGVNYSLGRTSYNYRIAVAQIANIQIDESDAHARKARSHAVGYQRGLVLSACLVMGGIGAFVGVVLGLACWCLFG